ncbi:DUF302 domain-containing protein [Gordonia sp. PDNC005]|uniref:DUF302 domain-containing protein n=1 Tax=unclassified Gordonia (in: high G+C Gram-positive bacteria) TaxID=2657482 RepID=UPI00196290F0|nr:DUF302 domain-containing protein [Gordonia sp. PDNC005]QRY60972.1 DUF302 domain-containing protein [Gordonia sp. PDNC005]
MTSFTMSTTVATQYDETVARVREALADAGFGVLTEIDIKATLKTKLDVDIEPKIILGACRPQLAHQALAADPRVAALLPCNVVVSADGPHSSLVEIMDPSVMEDFTGTAELGPIATDAKERLSGVLTALSEGL